MPDSPAMGRIEEIIAQTDGVAEFVTPLSAWHAAGIVTARFPVRSRVFNWFRLAFVTRAITNRERTAVIGVGGTRAAALVAAGFASAWLAPKLPRWLVAGIVGLVLAVSLRRGRIQRLWWISQTLRREAPGSLMVGEFASEKPWAGTEFAREVIDAVGARVTLVLTVQETDRRARSLVRLYRRQLGFEVLARRHMGDVDVILMVRPATVTSAPPLRAVS
jgi:hypothetical protein